MALKDRILADVHRVYMNMDHFCEEHLYNGKRIRCVVDEHEALKRKNNNIVDISWDNNSRETLIYTPVDSFPEREPMPNMMVIFDRRQMRVLQVNEDMGMYSILLASNEARTVQGGY